VPGHWRRHVSNVQSITRVGQRSNKGAGPGRVTFFWGSTRQHHSSAELSLLFVVAINIETRCISYQTPERHFPAPGLVVQRFRWMTSSAPARGREEHDEDVVCYSCTATAALYGMVQRTTGMHACTRACMLVKLSRAPTGFFLGGAVCFMTRL
jgi:hypothetical protein